MLEDNPVLARVVARFHIIIATVVSLIGAAIFGMAAGEGNFFIIYLGLILAGLAVIMIHLGSRYWLVIPFSFVCQLPFVPVSDKLIELPELVSVVGLAVFLVRYALKQQKFTMFRKEHVPVQLYAAWALLVFVNNPVGLAEMGASVGGFRFYAKIGLALISFIIMANQEIGENECRWIFMMILVGSAVAEIQDIVFFFFPFGTGSSGPVIDPSSYYSWHQALAIFPTTVILLIFSRYRASQIFSMRRIWVLGVFLLCLVMIVLSGKRAALAFVPITALCAAVARREFGYALLWLAGAAVAVAIVVIGHGDLFRLSLTAQRALSFLPARWDIELQYTEYGQDDFRAILRTMAREKIARDPWIGTGYKVDMHLVQQLTNQQTTGGVEAQALPNAIGSSWHNTWLGYAADFGIPASILVGIIYLFFLYRSWRTYRQSPADSLVHALALYIFLFTIRDLITTHTGGHSATDAFTRWWMYGTLVSLTLTNLQRRSAPSPVSVSAGRRLQPLLIDRPVRQPATQRPMAFR
jgi:hypothetical protein